ncbi:hypothetical protein F4861DRAFT_508249 [Xylaria intraflava]|nr:hypothetical protein F4861DRAFT_508249 [Xylaria intraflava]
MSPKTVHLKATYKSPTEPPKHLTSAPLPLPPNPPTPESKTAYLRALRAATTALQERINAELTARMEADNRSQAGTGGVNEAAEEENYGEEVQDGDEA